MGQRRYNLSIFHRIPVYRCFNYVLVFLRRCPPAYCRVNSYTAVSRTQLQHTETGL